MAALANYCRHFDRTRMYEPISLWSHFGKCLATSLPCRTSSGRPIPAARIQRI